MKLRTLLCLCMTAVAMPATAQQSIPGQLFLNFTDCTPSARNKDLNCLSTRSQTILVASATPGVDVSGVLADLGYIDVVVGTDPATMPPFWQFQSGGCAGTSRIRFDADFGAYSVCRDIWAGLGGTGGQWGGVVGPSPDGNRARVKWTTNVLPEQAFAITAGTEAYIEKIWLRQTQLTTCFGCPAPACAVYLSETFHLVDDSTVEIRGGAAGTEFLTFNDPTDNLTQCPSPILPDPTRNSTWGRVKSLYR